ncbi:hypothetical protein NQ117_08720 [Paenibacillus sp. SC116]|uniref:hypothetical protein n=1 Tax=Paenibacillus sp. SC116 TaxID=2968986 RepID=UPI00215AE5BC|nr:hypothetical protein [Paenibacillus sp. SC116]MCR8843769.1 hypothetical protein [Paenibacillus sp. SC116]
MKTIRKFQLLFTLLLCVTTITHATPLLAKKSGQQQTYLYDENNRMTHSIPSSGFMTVYNYDTNGNLVSLQAAVAASDNQFIEDMNGDVKADSILYYSKDGAWYVSLSTGTQFKPYSKWLDGHGVGSQQ